MKPYVSFAISGSLRNTKFRRELLRATLRALTTVALICGMLTVTAATAGAQDTVNVRVFAEPAGARFIVDGQAYSGVASFLWPKGSKHVLTVVTPNFSADDGGGTNCGTVVDERTQYDAQCRVRYAFGGWESNVGSLPSAGLLTQTITADPSVTFFKAMFNVQYRIAVALVDGPGTGPTAGCMAKANRPVEARQTGEGVGIVLVGGQCFDYSGVVWLPPGDISVQAIPFEGFAFAGWSMGGAQRMAPVITYTVRGAAEIAPRFQSAKRVLVLTDPVGLKVRVDRAEIRTIKPAEWVNAVPVPGRYDWLPGSKHVLGGVSPQTDDVIGRMWVFESWSNGGTQDMLYTADDKLGQQDTLVAKFVRGVQVNFLTEPRGLRLKVDGRENWPTYGFVWGLGSKYNVSAPEEQVDSRGRKWTFKGWKHGGPAAQEIVIDQAAIDSGGLYYTAIFEQVPQVTLQSSIPGMQIRVDGAECTAPCRVDKPVGTQIRVAVPERLPVSELTRYEFLGWHDGSEAERVITVGGDTAVFQANYRKANLLMTFLDPEDAGVFRAEPASADGFYAEGTDLMLTVEAKPGFKFRRWDGDLAGTIPSGALSMSMSRAVRALFERVPFLPEAAVSNAAGPTPVEGVAPGSLISISGASLTEAYEAGPASPLAQTLGGVVVLLKDRILPLVYVSPEQINAVLPSDLEPGSYRLVVRPQSGPEVGTEFNIVRNAPGLFQNMVEDRGYAVALREDGSQVTLSTKARRGEMLMLLGTGFGPYNRPVVDGFAVPASPEHNLIDPVTVTFGGVTLQPLWAGAQPGNTGVTGVRFRVPAEAAGDVEVRMSVNGAESNTVLLPVE